MRLVSRKYLPALLLVIFLLAACEPQLVHRLTPPASESQLALTLSLAGSASPTRNAPIEFIISGVPPVENPFDPAQAQLQLLLTDPSGATIKAEGYWYQAFSAYGSQPLDAGGWRARFTPTVSGKWRAKVLVLPANLSSKALDFAVAESSNRGFVRADAHHPRYFAYDNGERFLPIGINMGWWSDNPIQDYTRWLDHFAANGGNTIRLWMADWAFGIEWSDTGLGDYRKRMQQAWLLDEVFKLAGERGIKIILVLNHHGQFSQSVNPEWDQNPYNAKLGGPLAAPEEFASNEEAIAYFQQRLRYIVDRWGADPTLLAWDWWNEYNFTPISDAQMRPWLVRMDAFLRKHDLNRHLTTLSGPSGPASPIWQLAGIDVVSVHLYTTKDPLEFAPDLSAQYDELVPDKPLLLEEFGYNTSEENIDSTDKTGIHLHNGLWATLLSGQGGSGMYWWWDTYVEPLNLWPQFGSITRFLQGIDVAQFKPAPAIVLAAPGQEAAAEGLLLRSDSKLLLWIRNKAYTGAAVDAAHDKAVRDALRNHQVLKDFVYEPPVVDGEQAQIGDFPAGFYDVRWYDPQAGQWGRTEEIEAVDGVLTLALPTFSRDVAALITVRP